MPKTSIEELREFTRNAFGRLLEDDSLRVLSPRLLGIIPLVERLSKWQSDLGETEPATMFRISTRPPNGR